MISAREAREVAMWADDESVVGQRRIIEARIKDAAQRGYLSTGFEGVIYPENKRKLEGLGYKVESGTQYNESYFTVSWLIVI